MLKVNIQLQRGDFTLDIAFDQAARVTGVFGPSGAGKSTLMHVIAGLEKPDAGRIELDGDTLFDSAKGVNVPPHRRRIGVMFQDDRLFPQYSVEGNLRYGERASKHRGEARSAQRLLNFNRVVDLLGLRDLLARRTAALSGGERQRIALGRALLANPRLLLLDEPLSSLDAALKRQILPYLAKVRDAAGIPMVYVSHDLAELLQVTDHLLLLERGRAVAHGRYLDVVHASAASQAVRSGGLVNIIHATVMQHDRDAGVTRLALSTQTDPLMRMGDDPARAWAAPLHEHWPLLEVVTVMIDARDISLATERVHGVSIQNQIAGEVRKVTQRTASVLVEVNAGVTLLAEVTRRAVETLSLRPGKTVWCLIKSNAIRQAL